jgi:hypothetical protein
MTVGGDRLDAYQDVRSPAVGLIDTKLHLNSVISDAHKGARYFTVDLKDFFLQSLMHIFQYMRVHRKYLPIEIIEEYNLTEDYFDSQGYVYVEIRKGMYGLKEAAILAYDQLKAHLAPFGYAPVTHTPGLWRHATKPTTFTLAVDDFGVKYFSTPFVANMHSQSTGQATATSVSTLNGTTQQATLISRCPIMCPRHCKHCDTLHQPHPNMPRTNGHNQSTVPKSNLQQLTYPLFSTNLGSTESSKSLASFYTTPEAATRPSLSH